MNRQRRLIHVAIVLFAIFDLVVGWLIWANPTELQSRFRHVHKGMTPKQVKEIMGCSGRMEIPRTGFVAYVWEEREGTVVVHFEWNSAPDGFNYHAYGGGFSRGGVSERVDDTVLNKVRSWVKEWTGW